MSGWTSIIIKADSTKAEITGLSMYTKYAIQISGFNSKGQGSPSKVILVETDEDGKCLMNSFLINCWGLSTIVSLNAIVMPRFSTKPASPGPRGR